MAFAKTNAKANAHMGHPMAFANNHGMNFDLVIAGQIPCPKPDMVKIDADPSDLKYMSEYMRGHGAETAWLRRDAMSGNLTKKHRISCGLIEEWGPACKYLDGLTRTDIVCALEVLNPNEFTDQVFSEFADWADKDLRNVLYYEICCGPTTCMPHTLKQVSRTAIVERGEADKEKPGSDYKYEWQVTGDDPDVNALRRHFLFQTWGKFNRGSHPSVQVSHGFLQNRVWVTRSIERPGGLMYIDVLDIDINDNTVQVLWEKNCLAEACLVKRNAAGTEIGRYEMYSRFVAKYGADAMNEYMEPSPRNPNVGEAPSSVPATIAWKFIPKAGKTAQPKQGKQTAHAKGMANWHAGVDGGQIQNPGGFVAHAGGPPPKAGAVQVAGNVVLAPPPVKAVVKAAEPKANPDPGNIDPAPDADPAEDTDADAD